MSAAITYSIIYVISALSGYLCHLAGLPLPWMIGPLISTALVFASGLVKTGVSTKTRPIGQMIVATFIGAHFTPDALHALSQTAPLIVLASLYILANSAILALIQSRLFGFDTVTSFLFVVPTSPVEAGVQAEAHGIDVAPVVFSQTLRIAAVVLVVPFLVSTGAGQSTIATAIPASFNPFAMTLMLAGAAAGAAFFKGLGLSNPYFLGPLFASALLAGFGYQSFEMPSAVLAGGQIVLGTWLGSTFRKDVLMRSKRVAGALLFSTAGLLTLGLGGALVLSKFSDYSLDTLILGFAPGGATEMALTAGILGLDVALVTAFHLARIFIIMPSTGWIARRMSHTTAPQTRPQNQRA